MIFGSVCSGIEAASVAWHPLGWRAAFLSEIEPFPRSVLAHHYPDVPLHGDFTTIGDEYGPIDLLVGGTPCQSFSVAGLRKGLDDDRGNLALEFLRLADRTRPRWVVWENVPGVLSSSGGRDFGAFLGGLGECGYGWAYRVLDAQYVRVDSHARAVPQRRRRVFVVGYSGDWRRAAAVLFEREGMCGHTAPRREAGEGVAPNISARPSGGGGLGTDFDCDGGLVADWPVSVTSTLNAHFGDKMGLEDQHALGGASMFVPTVSNALTNHNGQRNEVSDMVNGLIAFDCKGSQVQTDTGGTAPTLRSMSHDGSHQNGGGQLAVAIDLYNGQITDQVAATLGTDGGGTSTGPSVMTSAIRRLTPMECERLQGFPSTQNSYTILVCQNLSDQQKGNALAALQCHKLRDNAWLAEGGRWKLSAEAAEHHSSTSHQNHAPPVAVDVLIDLERQAVQIHSAERSFSFATNAADKSAFRLPTEIESFAHLGALLTRVWAIKTPDGKAGSQENTKPFTHLQSGNSIAISYGRETGEHASDVQHAIAMASPLSMSTTLPPGQNIEVWRSTLTTLSFCVVHAIGGFIPERISKTSCFAVRVTTTQGYTLVPHRGKPAADGPRYKALGNSMAVNVMSWIGQRIAMVDDI